MKIFYTIIPGNRISILKQSIFLFLFLLPHNSFAQSDWFERDSEHFRVIYRKPQAYLVPHILSSAEEALKPLMRLFDYKPSSKIIINTYDVNDYGFASATTVPENFIRLEIEPLEPGYENVPYNDRIQWLISHELVHIVVNDHTTNIEAFTRKIFGKVAPEQVQPVTVLFSLLTNYGRYTPRWHQEAIAVFLETWFNGGFGRSLSNFDEMYFRSMVLDHEKFPTPISLDAKLTHNSFLLETLFYFYGARFATYLSIKYGYDKVIAWFKANPTDMYNSFINKFDETFHVDMDKAWSDFIEYEKSFQQHNIEKIKTAKLTSVRRLFSTPTGWATEPFYDKSDNSIIFGYHKPHHLAGIQKINLSTLDVEQISSLPTPSMLQVASLTYDNKLKYLFYTTNNNMLYRDIWVLDTRTKERKELFENYRIGSLTISSKTHDLWGILDSGGKTSLALSEYPYRTMQPIIGFNFGDELTQLSVSPSGKYLAAVLHRSNGEQYLVTTNCDSLKAGYPFKYFTITTSGSPENPSWSPDEKTLFWNAYTNGVSNIYRINLESNKIQAVSNTLRGLFRPVYLKEDSLFAFEFSAEGFYPVIIPNYPAERLPAISYMGQQIVNRNPEVVNLNLDTFNPNNINVKMSKEETYNGLEHLDILTFIPVISGFQKQKVLGLFTHISDPLINHDLTMEIGISPFNKNPVAPKFHFKAKYEYKKEFIIGIDHNAPDFYDLFNNRKRGMIGNKFRLGNVKYWIYDNPHKLVQNSEIALYKNVEYINDNLVRVSQPDFMVAQTILNSKNIRKSIGSSGFEEGDEYTITLMTFGFDPKNPQFAGEIHIEWDNYSAWLTEHNIFHYKLAAGYHYKNKHLYQAQYFFGGFGNRAIENVDAKQFRSVFRFPGIPIYSLNAVRFLKILAENHFPPLRFGNAALGQHYLNHIDFFIYSQALLVKSPLGSRWIDIGAQMDFIFKHWFNLESTLSAGIANAWYEKGNSWEWFISYKLLVN